MLLTPSKKEISTELKRILASKYFLNSKILSSFLEFIVVNTIEGRSQEIKEYTIGVHILKRQTKFNPQTDASVRIHAVRLRKILEKYYHSEDNTDSVIISMEKGSYVPEFRYKYTSATAINISIPQSKIYSKKRNITKPLIGVIPFTTYSIDPLEQFIVDGIGVKLTTDLSHFEDLSVLSYYSIAKRNSSRFDLTEIKEEYGLTHIVTGSINSFENEMVVSYELVDMCDFQIHWSDTITHPINHNSVYLILSDISAKIASLLGGYHGIIQVQKNEAIDIRQNFEEQITDAIFWYYHFTIRYTEDIFSMVRKKFEEAIELYPNYAITHAMLASIYIDPIMWGYKNVEDPLTKASHLIEKALKLDPKCQQAHFTSGLLNCIYGKTDAAKKDFENCLAINPNSTYFTHGISLGMSFLGEHEYSFQLLEGSKKSNPIHPWWNSLPYLFYYVHKNDLQKALFYANEINITEIIYHKVLAIPLMALLGQVDDAKRLGIEYHKKHPKGFETVIETLQAVLHDKQVYQILYDGYVLSGMMMEDTIHTENNRSRSNS